MRVPLLAALAIFLLLTAQPYAQCVPNGQECTLSGDPCCGAPEYSCRNEACLPPAQADLVPVIDDLANGNYHFNGQLSMLFRIRNNGSEPAAASNATIIWDGNPFGPILIPALEPDAEYFIPSSAYNTPAPLSCPDTPPPNNNHSLQLMADSTFDVSEPNGWEGNNNLQIDVICQPGTGFVASWVPFAAIGLIMGFSLVALMYMGGSALGRPELRASANDEFYQVLFTGLVVASFVVFQSVLQAYYLPAAQQALTGGALPASVSLTQGATDVTASYMQEVGWMMGRMESGIRKLGREGSKSAYCNFLGAGYSIVTCTTLNAARGPLSMGLNALSLAYADLSAQMLLLSSGDTFLLGLLLPAGIVLRTFRVSRPAGGALIAIALGFYFIFPSSVLFTRYYLIQDARALMPEVSSAAAEAAMNGLTDEDFVCHPTVMRQREVTDYTDSITATGFFRPILFIVLIQSVFATLLSLFITIVSVRYIAQILGAEIDVSALSRIS